MKALSLSQKILTREMVITPATAKVFGCLSFIIFTTLGAYVRIPLPFTPVPITLQTFFVLLSGAVLGRNWGAASQAGYLLLGLSGLPIFAGAGYGVAYLFGPTGGYLIGFIVSSWIMGRMLKRRTSRRLKQIALVMALASILGIYLFGLLGLVLFLHYNLSQAFILGFLPFIPGDIIKIISASLIFSKIEKRCQEIIG